MQYMRTTGRSILGYAVVDEDEDEDKDDEDDEDDEKVDM